MTNLLPNLGVLAQKLLPKQALSSLVGWLAARECGPLTTLAIRVFIRVYGVNMAEAAESSASAYATFNAFFTRSLRVGARVQPSAPTAVASPCDGVVSAAGPLEQGRLIQAKGLWYDLERLLGGDSETAQKFTGGRFVTIYLAPYDYHRVHMPLAGRLTGLRYEPGSLYSVNRATTCALPGLFHRNERVIAVFESEQGIFALVMVGALNVGSISLVLPGSMPFQNRPAPGNWTPRQTHQLTGEEHFGRGDEFGRFNMGSTVILLASKGCLDFEDLVESDVLRMGAVIGHINRAERD